MGLTRWCVTGPWVAVFHWYKGELEPGQGISVDKVWEYPVTVLSSLGCSVLYFCCFERSPTSTSDNGNIAHALNIYTHEVCTCVF